MNFLDVMEFFFNHRAEDLPPKALPEVFNRLVWCFDEEAYGQLREGRVKWLESDDPERAEIALQMREVFPYDTREEMVNKFDALTKKWPHLSQICDAIIANWDDIHKQDG